VSSPLDALRVLIERGLNVSPIVCYAPSTETNSAGRGMPVVYYYFSTEAGEGSMYNIATHIVDLEQITLEPGPEGHGRVFGMVPDRYPTKDLTKQLVPLLRKRHSAEIEGACDLAKAASEDVPNEDVGVWLGIKDAQLKIVVMAGEPPAAAFDTQPEIHGAWCNGVPVSEDDPGLRHLQRQRA
jgi:hypothetical protein